MSFKRIRAVCSSGGRNIYVMVMAIMFITSCVSVHETANRAISTAVHNVAERNVSAMMAGYSNMMLYQLAYTQAFHVGGFGIHPEFFTEGEGTVWRIEAGDGSEINSYTAERALLKINEDGSSWWYLNYRPEGDEALEYEIKMNLKLEPLEMYMRNVNTGEIDHHEFDTAYEEGEEAWETERELQRNGYQTDYYFLQEWEQYSRGTESVRISGRSYESQVLVYNTSNADNNDQTDFKWWVNEDIPGYLVKYEFHNGDNGARASGEMTKLKRGYQPKFVSL